MLNPVPDLLGSGAGEGDGEVKLGDGEGEVKLGDGDGDVKLGDGDGEVMLGDGDGEEMGAGDGEVTLGDGDTCDKRREHKTRKQEASAQGGSTRHAHSLLHHAQNRTKPPRL